MPPLPTCEVLSHWVASAVAKQEADQAIARYLGGAFDGT